MVGKIRAFIEYNLNEGFMFYSKSFLVVLIVAFHIGVIHSGNYRNLLTEKFCQINYLVISVIKPSLSRNFCQRSHIVEKCEILSHRIFPIVTLLVKTLISRNFCKTYVKVNFRNFHTGILLAPFSKMTNISWNELYRLYP